MKKLLIASTALSLAGGAAFAEISISGDAEMGVDYDSEASGGMSKHSFKHEVGIDFTASGTTDGGLTFGGSAGFDTNATDLNLGTVHVSGSFGTLTIGDNDPGSFIAGGIADIGMNGIGVDDMAENLRKGTASQLRYDNSFGQVSIAISAGTATVDGMMTKKAVEGVVGTPAVPGAYQYKPGGTADSMAFGNVFWAEPDADGMEPADGQRPAIIGTAYQIAVKGAIDGLIEGDTDSFDFNGAEINYDPDGSNSLDLATVRLGGTGDDPADGEDADKLYVIATGDLSTNASDEHVDAVKALANAYGTAENGGVDINKPTPGYVQVVAPVAAVEEVMAMDAVFAPDKSETQYAFGMSFEAGGVTIGVGYDSYKTVSMGAGFSAGEVSTNLLYVKTGEEHPKGERTGMGADMTYTMGASAVTLAYGRDKPEMGEAMDAVGMGVTHDLGGGATMNAGFGKVGESNKASIGLMFTF